MARKMLLQPRGDSSFAVATVGKPRAKYLHSPEGNPRTESWCSEYNSEYLVQQIGEALVLSRLPSYFPKEQVLCGLADALAFERLLAAHVDLDLLGLGFGLLGKLDFQDPLVVVRLHLFRIHRCRKRERAGKAAILPLHPAEVLFFLFHLELALAVHGQSVVLNPDIDVFLVDSRHFNLQRNVVLVLIDVHRGREVRGGKSLVAAVAVGVAEQAVHAVLQSGELTEWFPASKNCHDNPPESEFFEFWG